VSKTDWPEKELDLSVNPRRGEKPKKVLEMGRGKTTRLVTKRRDGGETLRTMYQELLPEGTSTIF